MAADLNDNPPLPLNSIDPETLFGRKEVCPALRVRGVRVSPATLATKATRGGGPKFRIFGKQAIYRWGDVVAWVLSEMGEPARTTAERRLESREQLDNDAETAREMAEAALRTADNEFLNDKADGADRPMANLQRSLGAPRKIPLPRGLQIRFKESL